MGDYADFCEMYGGCAGDPDFIDNWLAKYVTGDENHTSKSVKAKIESNDFLPKGKIVHIIKLLAEYPAKPVGIIWNKKLKESLDCSRANYLKSTDHDDPASWFVRKGFTVRSSKVGDYWYQVVFKENNNETRLSNIERKNYERLCPILNPEWFREQ
ncbi:TPA: hypothetical protein ACX6S0_002618 [Photobacterium damselae]